MGKIEVIAKWDIKNGTWNNNVSDLDRGRSLAFGSYDLINQTSTKGIDYIIFAFGSRVEDHSKNYIDIKEKQAGMAKLIKYFSNTKKQVIPKLFLMDADAPIKEDAKAFAHYIDTLSVLPTTKSINVIGLSKCGAMLVHMPKHFNVLTSFEKTNMYSVATPFDGTKMASPNLLYKEVNDLIENKLGKNAMSKAVYTNLIKFYESISSNSHMDYDIAKENGIPEEKLSSYDPSFIQTIFSWENIDALSKVNTYQNIRTGIDDNTLKEAIRTVDIVGIGLCIINDVFMEKASDGMVMKLSQRKIEDVLPTVKSHKIPSAHHNIVTNTRVFNDIMGLVNDTIEEQEDLVAFYKKTAEKNNIH